MAFSFWLWPAWSGRLDRRAELAQFGASRDSVPQATKSFAGLIGRGVWKRPARTTNQTWVWTSRRLKSSPFTS